MNRTTFSKRCSRSVRSYLRRKRVRANRKPRVELLEDRILMVYSVPPAAPSDGEGPPGLVRQIQIDVATPAGFRQLDSSVIPTVIPTVRIMLPQRPFHSVRVALDDTDPTTPTVDITNLFPGLLTARMATAEVPVDSDNNKITVTLSGRGPTVSTSASMLNFSTDTLVVSAFVPTNIASSGNIQFQRKMLLLNFRQDVPYEGPTSTEVAAINDLLRRERLRPVGLGVPIGLLRAEITTGEDPLSMAHRLATQASGILDAVLPDLVTEDHSVAAENLPQALRDTYRSSAGTRCTAGAGLQGCFDYDGADNTNQLRIFRYHFLMDTFAAHRLVDVIRASQGANWRNQEVGLAIIDRGLGDGVDPCGGAPPGPNPNNNTAAGVPCSAVFGVADLARATPYQFDANGVQTDTGMPVAPLNLDVGDIADIANSHGTHVTASALARGALSLGPGKDVRLRPIRKSPTFGENAYAVLAAARDQDVAVINTSWGNTGQAGQDAFLQANLEGALTDVAAAARGAGKVWIASLGNNGDNVGNTMFPAAFAPGPAARAAGDLLVMAISNSETAGLEETQALQNNQLREPERLRAKSNFGNRTSVAAPGGEVVLPVRTGALRADCTSNANSAMCSGTSFSAPVVAGIAAEMIYLDRNLHAAGQLTPLQIIELIEATAENLGSSVTANDVSKPNDRPGNNSPDDVFGHGRVNMWKAILAVANGGLATDRSGEFPSLDDDGTDGDGARVINDAETTWYGFKILTGVQGATVWLDGVQLKESAAILPDAGAAAAGAVTDKISAYAGVGSDHASRLGIPGEDPTAGIVPVGNRGGEFAMTFSAQRADLLDADRRGRTLSLRRPGQTAADAPYFNLKLDLTAMRQGQVAGVVFDDFVFHVTPGDFGDGPEELVYEDPGFRTTQFQNGPRHLNSNLEWFGKYDRPGVQSVSAEQNALAVPDPDGVSNITYEFSFSTPTADRDGADDGVVFYPLTYLPGGKGKLDFSVCSANPGSGRYSNDADHSLYVNGWIDWSASRSWQEGDEHVIDGVRLVPSKINDQRWTVQGNRKPATTVDRLAPSASGRCGSFRATFDVPNHLGQGEIWARFRLDYGEDVGRNNADEPKDPPRPFFPHVAGLDLTQGAARFGEVEDYRIGSDFGDAPDNYPVRASKKGARHLDIYKEFLGIDKTREPDACLKKVEASADEDGAPNIGFVEDNCLDPNKDLAKADDSIVAINGSSVVVTFTTHSSIATRGYDLMGLDEDGDGRFDEDPKADGINDDAQGIDGEDGPNLMKVTSLDSKDGICAYKQFDVWSTPQSSGGKGRYHATPIDDDRDKSFNEDAINGVDDDGDGLVDEDFAGLKPLHANIWIDWNNDAIWNPGDEWVLQDALIAPETFGANQAYTLGEPFEDTNHDGVRQSGEPFRDGSGVETKQFTCSFMAPSGTEVGNIGWVRIRLAYAEMSDKTISGSASVSSEKLVEAGLAYNSEAARALAMEKGGALFGEVEDYPPPRGGIHGRKVQDSDGNGRPNPGEPGLNHWTIQLWPVGGPQVQTQTTMDMDLNGDGVIAPDLERGWYWFPGLPPGQYLITEELQPGWQQVFPTLDTPQTFGAVPVPTQFFIHDNPRLGPVSWLMNLQSDETVEQLEFANRELFTNLVAISVPTVQSNGTMHVTSNASGLIVQQPLDSVRSWLTSAHSAVDQFFDSMARSDPAIAIDRLATILSEQVDGLARANTIDLVLGDAFDDLRPRRGNKDTRPSKSGSLFELIY